ncbi:MAG: glycosyltransferase family 9 protein [bacterium]|nr:glycosyltransferase family 9 protein [bacterium]
MKTLVVKTHAFGDSLLATPAVRGLVSRGDEVTVLSGPSSVEVWKRLPGISGVVESPSPCSNMKLLKWSFFNRQPGFDRVIHLGSSRAVALWLKFLTGMNVESGSSRKTGFGIQKPVAREFCRIAGVACNDDLKPVFPVTAEERECALLHTGTDPYVVLAPGGARNARDFVPEKRWPMERWADISVFLNKLGFKVFLAGGKMDVREISSVSGINLAGKLSWGETAALIASSALFAGNDSGPAHLAVSTDTPSVVLFGPTDPDSLFQKGSITAVRGNSPCSPCYANSIFPGCKGERNCMASIDTERVKTILEEMLQR